MASSSSPSESNSQYSCPQQKCKYNVFLSFRGTDTRNNFTGHLYQRLNSRGIFTFLDEKRLENGDSLSEELVKAMEESEVAVIIFSKKYATSSWCLNELVKIMECKEENGQLVIPIFYDVDPSHVRYQSESFAEAFAKHESRYKDDVDGMQKVQQWRTALTAAANIKGHNIRDKIEADCIGDLVSEISRKLCRTSLSRLKDIVGIDAHLKEVNSLLYMTIDDVRRKFPSLRRLVLSGCENLRGTPDFTDMPNLEDLVLEECRNFKEVHHSLKNSKKLKKLNLIDCKSLERFECVSGVSLEYLYIQGCSSLEKFPRIIQHQSRLTELDLSGMKNLTKLESSIGKLKHLVMLKVSYCSKLSSLPKKIGDLENLEILEASYTLISQPPSSIARLNRLKLLTFAKQKSEVGLEDGVRFVFPRVNGGLHSLEDLDLSYCNLIDEGLPEDIESLSSLKKLNLRGNNFEHLPQRMARLGSLHFLNLLDCQSLTQLPEDIGDLENLENLDARGTLISQPPSSIFRLNRLKLLTFAKQKSEVGLEDEVHFVFPPVNHGLCSLETLNLGYCNLNDRGLPEDIGSLSSLKVLNLRGNNFEHLPQSMAQLGSLQSLDITDCKSLTQLPEFPRQLDTIYADWSNDLICKSLFQNISSLRVFTNEWKNIPRRFHHQGKDKSVSVKLPENWYVCDNFLGFAVCYSGCLIETTAQFLCDEGMPCITQKLALPKHSEEFPESAIHFFLVPSAGLLDTSKANEKTPNDYRHIMLSFSEELKDFGLCLLYKDKLKALFKMTENNDDPTEHCVVKRRGPYDEARCSSSKKQRSQL